METTFFYTIFVYVHLDLDFFPEPKRIKIYKFSCFYKKQFISRFHYPQ